MDEMAERDRANPTLGDRLIRLETQFEEFRAYVTGRFVDYGQHLSDLNHVKEDAVRTSMLDRETLLRKDVYAEVHGSLAERVRAVETWQTRFGVGIVLSIVAGIVAVALRLFLK